MKAIRYFRPDMLFALTPWHLARVCPVCGGDRLHIEIDPETGGCDVADCYACRGAGWIVACGYTPPEGWRAEVKERGPRCVECEEMVEHENARSRNVV